MTHTKTLFLGSVMVIAIGFTVTSALAGVTGNWKRPDGSFAKVWDCGSGLCASSGKTKIFDGIVKTGKNTWKGYMKHPDMPGYMTLNGTINYRGNTMKVRGCMFGNSGCRAETWKK